MEPGDVWVAQRRMCGQPLVGIEAQQGLDHVNCFRAGRRVEDLGQRSAFHGGRLVQDGLSVVGTDLLEGNRHAHEIQLKKIK